MPDVFKFVVSLGELPAVGAAQLPIITTGSWVKNGREISFTKEDLETAIANFNKLENHDLNVDYDHASEELQRAEGGPTPSAGRIFQLSPPQPYKDGRWILYGSYEPTDRARALIRAKEYRYTSAAFAKIYPDRRTGEDQGMTLTSVALTNTPFLDNLPEIQLSGAVETGNSKLETRNSEPPRLSAEKGGTMALHLKYSAADGQHHHEVHDGNGKVGEIDHSEFCHYAAQHGQFSVADITGGSEKLSTDLRNHFIGTFAKEAGAEGLTATQVSELLAAGKGAQQAAKKAEGRTLLSAIFTADKPDADKADELLAQGKVEILDVRAAERARKRVDDALSAGKILPIDFNVCYGVAFSDGKRFEEWVSKRPGQRLGITIGAQRPLTGAESDAEAREDFSVLAHTKAEELLSANPRLSPARAKRQAAELVRKEHPELASRRRNEPEHKMNVQQ